jgi:EAL domain-containing protein (putative c-di-GMP-specific phosphodiesterase class I)
MCPFDEIKIDRSFVAGLDTDRTDTAVISSIIALGSSLDLAVVAEGVETPTQHARLRAMGCTVSQGYLHHRPAAADTLTTLLLRETTAQQSWHS